MSYSDISKNVKDIYGIEVSDSTIHSVTEQIVPLLNDWRNRTLEKTYTVVFLDAMYFKGSSFVNFVCTKKINKLELFFQASQ